MNVILTFRAIVLVNIFKLKMPFLFTHNEYVDMMLVFGESGRNRRNARTLYAERFPERRLPSGRTFQYVEMKMRQGVFPTARHTHHQRGARTQENEVDALAYVVIFPHVSVRSLAQELHVSKSTVHRILKAHKYRPFKIHLNQELRPDDFERRLTFIAHIQALMDENPNILNRILWSDESHFHNNGVVNRHNSHYWSVENPHWVRQARFQTRWGVNVWCGLFNGRFIGPYFYDGTLTGERYLLFLQNELPELLEDIPLLERAEMMWQQDGAPPHNCGRVTEFLNNMFPQYWIGNRGPFLWPARSPDLSPLDYFIWGYLKELVYATQPRDLEDLKNKIREAAGSVTPEMIRAACTRELMRRFEACVEADGGSFEHILHGN